MERSGIGRPPGEEKKKKLIRPPLLAQKIELVRVSPLRTPVEALNPWKNAGVKTNGKGPLQRQSPTAKTGRKLVIMRKNARKKKITGERGGPQKASRPQYEDYEDKAEDDMWDDDVEPDYNPRMNITEKRKEIPRIRRRLIFNSPPIH
ncbi:MAG UNVERIFIED_CONTAM: hypothetical protein LVR29_14630 [Microcystis novacekii LVE1205-3]